MQPTPVNGPRHSRQAQDRTIKCHWFANDQHQGRSGQSNFKLLKDRTGTCAAPISRRKLSKWIARQRREMNEGKLPLEKQIQLDSIGFQWKPINQVAIPEQDYQTTNLLAKGNFCTFIGTSNTIKCMIINTNALHLIKVYSIHVSIH